MADRIDDGGTDAILPLFSHREGKSLLQRIMSFFVDRSNRNEELSLGTTSVTSIEIN